MNPDRPLIDQLYGKKVLRARQRTPGERMGDVLELSEMCFGKDDPELRRRLAIVRRHRGTRLLWPTATAIMTSREGVVALLEHLWRANRS